MLDPTVHFYIRTSVALVVAVGILIPCYRYTIGPKVPRPIPVENFIALNITVFIVLGFAMVISAADRWPAACLWAGAAMLGGGIIGVLFGVPTATDAREKEANKAAAKEAMDRGAEAPIPTPARSHTLMADTASWMSKFLAGAGFAQAGNILAYFVRVSRAVANYIVFPVAGTSATALGAGLLLYFSILGFFCGLILPYYYVKNLLKTGDAGSSGGGEAAQE